jgi:hypothetical protein
LPAPPEAAEAVLDHDSNSNCVIDGVRTESLVWSTVAPSGKYGIYVNMYDACKQPAAHFEVSVYSVVAKKNGDEQLHRWYSQSGELLDLSANGGSQMGLFVTEFVFK